MDDLTGTKLQRAYELIKAGKAAQAREMLIPLARAHPEVGDIWFLLGHAASDPQEKIRYFREAVRLEPDNLPAQKQIAKLLGKGGRQPKKQSRAVFWVLAALAGVFICLAGAGIYWSFNNLLLSRSPAPTIAGSTATRRPTARPTARNTAAAATARFSPTPSPTPRPSITMQPTLTAQPSVTTIPTITLTFTITPSTTVGPKQKPASSACAAPNGLGPLVAPFKIENFGKDGSTIYIKGASKNGDHPVSCQIIVKRGLPVIIDLMIGDFEYTVFRGSSTRTGSFFITKTDKTTMRIFDDKIQIGPFP